MTGIADCHHRCTETFLEMRCSLAVGHDVRHQAADGERTYRWGWADDPEFAHMTFTREIDVIGAAGETAYSYVVPERSEVQDSDLLKGETE